MFKKMIMGVMAAFLCVTLLMSGMIVSARIETVEFALSANDAEVGGAVTIALSIPADSYFTNATMHLHYDSTALSFIEEDVGEASAKGAMFMVNDKPAENTLSAAYVTINGIKKGGVLMTFKFEVVEKKPVAVSLSFNECVGVDENDVEFDVKYTTKGCVINNDGSYTEPTAAAPTTTATEPQATESVPVQTTTSASGQALQTNASAANTVVSTAGGVATTTAASVQTTVVYVPVTDAQGVTVTDAQGETVTEAQNILVTYDQAEATTTQIVTVTDAKGEAVTDAQGDVVTSIVTEAVTTTDTSATTTTVAQAADREDDGGMIWWILAAIFAVSAGIAVAAVMIVKKKKANTEE